MSHGILLAIGFTLTYVLTGVLQRYAKCMQLVWMSFPQTKASLNKAQCRDFLSLKSKQRSNKQNLLAHFDEDGVIVLYSCAGVAEAICHHAWQALFLGDCGCYGKNWQVWGFGHGLMEKCLTPYIGLTGKAILVKIDTDFFDMNQDEQRQYVDAFLANAVTHRVEFVQNYRLQPIPILGIKGWYAKQDIDFYRNTHYFRTKSQLQKPVIRLS